MTNVTLAACHSKSIKTGLEGWSKKTGDRSDSWSGKGRETERELEGEVDEKQTITRKDEEKQGGKEEMKRTLWREEERSECRPERMMIERGDSGCEFRKGLEGDSVLSLNTH